MKDFRTRRCHTSFAMAMAVLCIAQRVVCMRMVVLCCAVLSRTSAAVHCFALCAVQRVCSPWKRPLAAFYPPFDLT